MNENTADHVEEATEAPGELDPPSRGRHVMISGPGGPRRLHYSAVGPLGGRLVVFESDAFGCSADFAWLQAALADEVSSLAYDRGGLGLSDPGPAPRDSETIAYELSALLESLDAPGPIILVAQGQGACHAHVFARMRPELMGGLVLLDALPPTALAEPAGERAAKIRMAPGRFTPAAARAGLLSAIGAFAGDPIGLPPEAAAERRRIMASSRHQTNSAQEAELWFVDAEEARAAGQIDRELPVAVVATAKLGHPLNGLQVEPARRSRQGWAVTAEGAGGSDLLGKRKGDVTLQAIRHVLQTLG